MFGRAVCAALGREYHDPGVSCARVHVRGSFLPRPPQSLSAPAVVMLADARHIQSLHWCIGSACAPRQRPLRRVVICATPDAAAACCALVCAAGAATNVRYALSFGLQPPSWNASIWHAEFVNAATEEDWLNCGPVFNTTAHQEYLATCQDDDTWVDSKGDGCAAYYRVGVGEGGQDDHCTDPGDPPENYADANGISAWDRCCVCKVYKQVQPLEGKIAVMTLGYCGWASVGYWSSLYGSNWNYPGRAYRRAYRAQLAGAIGLIQVRRRTWCEDTHNEDLVPHDVVHTGNHWDTVSNDKKVMPACAMCVRARARCTLERVSCCMPKHAALAFRGSVGAVSSKLCPARSLSQSHIVQWGASVTIPVFFMSGGDGARVKAALGAGARLRVKPLLEPWQGELGGVWDDFDGVGSANGTCSSSEMVGPSTDPCAAPYDFRGLSRGEGGVPMCVSEEDGSAPWCQASSGRVDSVCPNETDVWDGVKSGFARLNITGGFADCSPGSYHETGACVPCPNGTFSKVAGASGSTACRPCPPNSVSAAGSNTCSCVAGFFGRGDGCVSRDKFVESERSDDAFEGITAAPRNTNSVTRTFLNVIFIRHAADHLSMPSESFRFPNPLQTAQAMTPRRDYFASAITILLLGMSLCVIMFRKRKNVCNVRNVCIAIFFYGLLPTIDQWGASASKPRSWLSKNAMSSGQAPIPRQGYGLALVDANVFLHGGHTGADYATLNDMYVLSPENKLWTDITDLVTGDVPLPRSYFGFVPVGDAIFLFGGYRCNQCNMYDDLFKFWPSAMRWDKLSPSGSRPGGRSQAAYGSLGTKMYMHGGLGCGGTGFPCPRNDLWVFDTQSNTWTHLGNPGARAEHSMIIYRESLYLVGGVLPSSCSPWYECQHAVPKSWRYDLGTKLWETMEHVLYRRGVNVAVMSGKFYFIGGTGYTIPLLDDRYYYPASDEANLEFDVETNVQRAIPDTYGTYVSGAMKTSKFFHCPLLKKVLFLSLCLVDFFIPFSPLLTQLWF